jgi:[pyruvate, water dikinase]-phosphate phosphotransferase / [pyruvate, water dikinase] kinase
MVRPIFFVSDGTGITAETLGRSLLTQFKGIEFEFHTFPYVNSLDKAWEVVSKVDDFYQKNKAKPIIFSTIIDHNVIKILYEAKGMLVDFFQKFLDSLEIELGTKSSPEVGLSHGAKNYDNYMLRISAINYALANDDGANTNEYQHADIILIGVSRCGKTPTCLYLALQFGLFAANYPLTEEDLNSSYLPKTLTPYREKLFGLTIDPLRLHQIRQERKANSRYSSIEQCTYELQMVVNLFNQEKIKYLDTTTRSIEELATEILQATKIKRKL